MPVGKITATGVVIALLTQIASFDVAMLIAVVTLEQNVIVIFAVKMTAMMIVRDSIGKLVVIKAAAMTHIVTFDFAKLAVAKKAVANKGVANVVVAIEIVVIAIVELTFKGCGKLQPIRIRGSNQKPS